MKKTDKKNSKSLQTCFEFLITFIQQDTLPSINSGTTHLIVARNEAGLYAFKQGIPEQIQNRCLNLNRSNASDICQRL